MASSPAVCNFGWKAVPFELPDTEGTLWTINRLKRRHGLLVVFICNHCPYVIAIADRLRPLAADLRDLGIGIAAICSNSAVTHPQDSFENMGKFAREHRFDFPYLHDADQRVARTWGAACTPDFFGFNGDLELQYRGRLDDSGKSQTPGARPELLEAMRLVAETGKGPERQVPSMGCSIKWELA
ncbi:thioredoxin family protein [Amaricoccus tamworthensis]|uniref:thioredoxin family protein n=1 Tax=Amaricoccus tamworthensis TaxID=57002 RepID=UPI003C7BE555